MIKDSASQRKIEEKAELNSAPPLSKDIVTSSAQVAPKDETKYTTIDGVEYVNNEYLENQEFNLEGKKTFLYYA